MLKSLMHQSSDVSKAISEAWEQSEKPEIFTVKVIDPGKKGFLGFSHRPAIISFTYHEAGAVLVPSSQHKKALDKIEGSEKGKGRQRRNRTERGQSGRGRRGQDDQVDAQVSPQSGNEQKKVDQQPRQKKANERSGQSKVENKPQNKKPNSEATGKHPVKKKPVDSAPDEKWSDELASKAAVWLEGLFLTLGFSGKVEIKADPESSSKFSSGDKLLTVKVDGPSNSESQVPALLANNLFVCACATLAVQSLRNNTGKRLKGLRIKIVTSDKES